MKRHSSRNSFNPHSRHGLHASRTTPQSPRVIIRNALDFLHDHLFVAILILALCLIAAWYLLSRHQTFTTTSPSADSVDAPVLEKGTPDYDTVVPKGRTAKNIDWTRVSPPDHNPVYTYVDTVDKATLNVSEQPVPDNFKNDPTTSLEQLAGSYNATQKLTVGTVTVYIGTSTKGPQSVIFIKKNVLVLIKTDIGLTTDQWIFYISSLQ